MFDVVDDVLVSYGKLSKQIYSIKDRAREEQEASFDLEVEIEALKKQLSRMILDSEDRGELGAITLKNHFDYFTTKLMSTFTYFNPDWNKPKEKPL